MLSIGKWNRTVAIGKNARGEIVSVRGQPLERFEVFLRSPGGISSADPDYLPFGFIESSMARIRVISPFRESR